MCRNTIPEVNHVCGFSISYTYYTQIIIKSQMTIYFIIEVIKLILKTRNIIKREVTLVWEFL